ncbi:MAG: hypothetical protein LBG83_05850 [Oscillospiraceae bacterium]|jgi:hypothetical protein|nr:hypothetical protein [Oscillospiraceae bacterium]
MFNELLSNIGSFMSALNVPQNVGQGFLSFLEFCLTGGKFFVDLFKKLFTLGK